MEIGSGVGLTGLTIVSSCEPRAYYFSDCHPMVLKTLKENLRLNLLEKNELFWKEILSENRISYEKKMPEEKMTVEVLHFNWEDIDSLDLKSMKIDLVIAADILYDNRTFDSLASCLKKFLNSTVEYVILAATVRNETTVSEFLNKLGRLIVFYFLKNEASFCLQLYKIRFIQQIEMISHSKKKQRRRRKYLYNQKTHPLEY